VEAVEIPEEPKTYCLAKEDIDVLVEELKVQLEPVERIRFAFLHGSAISGLPAHDLDVAVYYDNRSTKDYRMEASLNLSVTLTFLLGIPVDIHPLNDTDLGFQFEAIKGIAVFARGNDELSEYMQKTWSMFLDYEPLLRQAVSDLLPGN
jgi:predicted nucleotidyltransferase